MVLQVFFYGNVHVVNPLNVSYWQILQTAVTITANGGTAPAASLFPFWDKKEIVKTFIVVTDEEENQSFNGFRLVQAFI